MLYLNSHHVQMHDHSINMYYLMVTNLIKIFDYYLVGFVAMTVASVVFHLLVDLFQMLMTPLSTVIVVVVLIAVEVPPQPLTGYP